MRTAIIALVALPGLVAAQPAKTKGVDVRSKVITQAILPEFAARVQGPGPFVESYTEDNPCTPHSHEYTRYLEVWRRSGSFPDPTAVLYRDGVEVAKWTLTLPPGGNTTVRIGKFTWTSSHPCPGGGTVIGSPEQPNYRLVVDPLNRVAEQTEDNNTVTFYLDPSIPLVKLP